MEIVYKLRNRDTGLFKCKRSPNGASLAYTVSGDIYSTKGIAKSALAGIIKRRPELKNKLELIAFQLIEITE